MPYFRHVEHEGRLVHDGVAFCDEEGKLKSLPYNQDATEQWEYSLMHQGRALAGLDFLVGPVIVVWGDKDFMGAL
ncbi:hypothetical protein [Nitrobacter sp. JJSN]|uniref:hypothetical protein n=1 Tax=Nitrobacter sp. JJSN TaxID=3453033 RepID=UPI003F7626EA